MSDSALALLFEISADPSKGIDATGAFRDQASAALRDFEKQMFSTMTNALGITKEFALGMGVAAGAVIGVGLAMFKLADRAAEVGGKMYEASEKTNLSASALSALNALSVQTDESFDSLATSLARATINMDKAAHSTDDADQGLRKAIGGAKGFAELGLKPVDDQLQIVLTRIFAMNDVGERNRALSELMGRSWQGNFSTLQMLVEQGYGPAIAKAKELGIYFDDPAAAKARQYQLTWIQVKASFEATGLVLGSTLLPLMDAILRNVLVQIEYLKRYGSVISLVINGELGKAAILAATVTAGGESMIAIINRVDKEMEGLAGVQKHVTGTSDVLKGKTVEVSTAFKEWAASLPSVENALQRIEALHYEKYIEQNKVQLDILVASMRGLGDLLAVDEAALLRILMTGKQVAAMPSDVSGGNKGTPEWATRYADALKGVNLNIKESDTQLTYQAGILRTVAVLWGDVTTATGHAAKAQESWADITADGMGVAADAFRGFHAVEMGLIIARASIKVYESIADSSRAFAAHDYKSGVLYALAATQYAVVAAGQIGGGGGGGSHGGGDGAGSNDSGGGGAAAGPVRMAPGAIRGTGGGLIVHVMGKDEHAQYLSKVLNDGVRYQGNMLIASHQLGQ